MDNTTPHNQNGTISLGARADSSQANSLPGGAPAPIVNPTQPQAQPQNNVQQRVPPSTTLGVQQSSPISANPTQPADSTASPYQFANYMQTAIDKLNQNSDLLKQRQLLIKNLYDSPLTPQEISQLPTPIQQAINSGDKSNMEMQLRLINDGISGRANTLNQSVNFLTTAYKNSLDEAETKKNDAQTIIENALNRSGSAAFSNYPAATKRQLEQSAGYPTGYLDYVSPTINQSRFAAQYGSGSGGTTVSIPPGSIAARTNNPLNIKFSNTTAGFGGNDSGITAQDGGTFAQFSSPQAGLSAAEQLLTSDIYSGLTVDQAMKKWSNNGYGADITSIEPNRAMSSLTQSELDQLVSDMAGRESGSTILKAGLSPLSGTTVGNTTFGVVPSGVTQTNALNGQAIIEGKQPPTIANSISGAGFQIKGYLAANGYNLTTATEDYDAVKKWQQTANSSTYQRAIVASDSAKKYIKNLRDLSDKWDRSNFPPLTKAELNLALNGVLGSEAQNIAQKVQTQVADLEADMASVYRYGLSSTNSSLENASRTLSTDWGNNRLQASLDVIEPNLDIRINSLKSPANIISASGTTDNQYVGGSSNSGSTTNSNDPLGIRSQ